MKKDVVTTNEILEAIQSFAADVDQRFERIDQRFEKIDQRFEKIEKQLDYMNRQFVYIDDRFDTVNARLARIETSMATKQDMKKLTEKLVRKGVFTPADAADMMRARPAGA